MLPQALFSVVIPDALTTLLLTVIPALPQSLIVTFSITTGLSTVPSSNMLIPCFVFADPIIDRFLIAAPASALTMEL